MTVRVPEEHLLVAVSARHRAALELDSVLVEPCAGELEIVDLEREMTSHAAHRSLPRVGLARATRRMGVREQVDLRASEAKPRAVEGEVPGPWHLLEPERARVETAGSVEIGDDEPDVLDAQGHDAYRNLAPPRKETPMPLIKVDLFDYRMSDETSAALIEKLTDALCEATHPGLKDHTWVIVEGHNPKNWGLGGKPWPVDEMPPGPES